MRVRAESNGSERNALSLMGVRVCTEPNGSESMY